MMQAMEITSKVWLEGSCLQLVYTAFGMRGMEEFLRMSKEVVMMCSKALRKY